LSYSSGLFSFLNDDDDEEEEEKKEKKDYAK